MLDENLTLILTRTQLSLFHPMGELLIFTNGVQVNNILIVNITWPKPLSVTFLRVSLCTLHAALFSPHFCHQNILLLCNKSVSTNIYGGTKPQTFESLKILKIQKLFWPLFWGQFWDPGLLPLFSILSFGLTTSPSPTFSYLSCFLLYGNA